ncbi:MAG: hypothetical protein Q8Q74_21955, partial [Polaromonas sp.]|nr:hypothetical protein [Polaromonas sp.]
MIRRPSIQFATDPGTLPKVATSSNPTEYVSVGSPTRIAPDAVGRTEAAAKTLKSCPAGRK